MRNLFAAALALFTASTLHAQAAVDLGAVPPLGGTWRFALLSTGSEASFADMASRPQVTLRCTRATRRVTISKPASAAAAAMTVWTSSASRPVATSFNPATGQLSADLLATDPLLDAMAFSRGRIGFTVAGTPALVVPAWPEVARVIEDCRA